MIQERRFCHGIEKVCKMGCSLNSCGSNRGGIFLRDPIGIGEYNKDRLRNKDSARSEKVMEAMPEELKDYVENKLFEKYDDHLIFIETGGAYYAMVDVSGTLLKIDAKTHSVKELFSLQKYSCNIKACK